MSLQLSFRINSVSSYVVAMSPFVFRWAQVKSLEFLWSKRHVFHYLKGMILLPYMIYGLYKLVNDPEFMSLIEKWKREGKIQTPKGSNFIRSRIP